MVEWAAKWGIEGLAPKGLLAGPAMAFAEFPADFPFGWEERVLFFNPTCWSRAQENEHKNGNSFFPTHSGSDGGPQ
jgi:hypothetical protein